MNDVINESNNAWQPKTWVVILLGLTCGANKPFNYTGMTIPDGF